MQATVISTQYMINNKPVQVSIIIACRNEAAHIRGFLSSLLAQDMGGRSWEAIIADGMSTDGTREILEEYARCHPELRAISNPGLIAATGLNAGIRQARGSYIIRFDAHTYYAPNYCLQCIEQLDCTGASNVGGPARTRVKGKRERVLASAYHSRFSSGGARFHDENFEGWVDTVPYGCWRKETLDRLGMFDELLVRNEDDELNLRLVRAGGKIWQSPKIVSWYSPRSTLSNLFQQYFQYGFWKVIVIRKHRIPAAWRHLIPVTFVLANVLLPASMVLSVAMGARGSLRTASVLWLVMLSTYLVASIVASMLAARRAGWQSVFYLPLVFATYHLSYGIGFVAGLFWFMLKPASAMNPDSAFTRLTR